MKICPFLVAGQDSMQRGGLRVSWHETGAGDQHVDTASDAEAQAQEQPSTTTQLWAIDEEHEPTTPSLECLGEPCRFFHAGGCRFDHLFAGNLGSGESTMQSLLLQEGDGPTLGSVVQEMWSLQRENLKEMIGGFRRLEGSQKQQQGGLRDHLEEFASRLEEARTQDPHIHKILEERFTALQSDVAALEKLLQSSLGSSAADLKSALETTHDALAQVREDTGRNLQEGFEATRRLLQEGRQATEQLVRKEREEARGLLRQHLDGAIQSLQREVEQTRHLLQENRDASSSLVNENRNETRKLLHESQRQTLQGIQTSHRSLQTRIDEMPALLQNALNDTQAQLQKLVAQNSSESRAELERTLQRVLEDNRHMQELRDELRQSLQTLTSNVRQVTEAAGTLAGSSRRAEELLTEQRNLSEALLQRERQEEARRLNNAGVLAYHEGAFDRSVAKFRQALELDPSMTEAWNNLGLSFTEMHQDGDALEAFKKALELDPQGARVYNNLGYLYHRRGELEQAVEMYERATQRAQDTSAAWSNLGNALHALGRTDEALKAWKRALELDPTNDKASHALERLGLGARD